MSTSTCQCRECKDISKNPYSPDKTINQMNMNKQTQDTKKKVEEILNDFLYDCDSDHGDKSLPVGIKEYTDAILKIIDEEKEMARRSVKISQREWQKRKKAEGLCQQCGKGKIYKGSYCQTHYEQMRIRVKKLQLSHKKI